MYVNYISIKCMLIIIIGYLKLAKELLCWMANGKVSTQKNLDDWKDGMNLTR